MQLSKFRIPRWLTEGVSVYVEGDRKPAWRRNMDMTLFNRYHNDRLMRLEAPFTGKPGEVFRAEHRVVGWGGGWGAESGTLMLTQRERMRRWLYTWLLDVDKGTSDRRLHVLQARFQFGF